MKYELKESLLKVENVSFSYGEGKVLHDINLEIKNITRPECTQGQVISIISRSGGGKSTLFNLLSGFSQPDTGVIKIGTNLHPVKMGEVGVVPQKYPLLNHRTIYENFEIALHGVKPGERKKTIHEYSDYFELFAQLPKYPKQLSGGQRQRAAILQQILAGNTFILLDEPFSGLDYIIKDKATELLIKASNISEENTLVIVSHDIESACAISDHVFILGSDGINPGSTIIKTYDFLEMDLAYHADIKEMPAFRKVIQEIKSIM